MLVYPDVLIFVQGKAEAEKDMEWQIQKLELMQVCGPRNVASL